MVLPATASVAAAQVANNVGQPIQQEINHKRDGRVKRNVHADIESLKVQISGGVHATGTGKELKAGRPKSSGGASEMLKFYGWTQADLRKLGSYIKGDIWGNQMDQDRTWAQHSLQDRSSMIQSVFKWDRTKIGGKFKLVDAEVREAILDRFITTAVNNERRRTRNEEKQKSAVEIERVDTSEVHTIEESSSPLTMTNTPNQISPDSAFEIDPVLVELDRTKAEAERTSLQDKDRINTYDVESELSEEEANVAPTRTTGKIAAPPPTLRPEAVGPLAKKSSSKHLTQPSTESAEAASPNLDSPASAPEPPNPSNAPQELITAPALTPAQKAAATRAANKANKAALAALTAQEIQPANETSRKTRKRPADDAKVAGRANKRR